MSIALEPPALQPLSARSIVLSLLLGQHPPAMHVRHVVAAAEEFGVAEATVRVALTRMVAAGELERTDGAYRLNARLLERQRRQDESITPQTMPWNGDWEQAVVVVSGRTAAERAQLRTDLARLRLAELREGLWMRPANLDRPWPEELEPVLTRFAARPVSDDRMLAERLWDLAAWASTAERLLAHFQSATDPLVRLTAAAAMVHHLVSDPVLPPELLQPNWPGQVLRQTYAGYRAELLIFTASYQSASLHDV